MTTLPTTFPRVPLKQMDASMLVFELDRETQRLMAGSSELITSAATMASFLHRKQTRFIRGGLPRVPYIEHPLRVALRLIRWGVRDAELIAAALLHDVVEDCFEELLEVFGHNDEDAMECLTRLYGAQVAELVGEVTNPATCGSEDAASRGRYVRHIVALTSTGSPALLIKASDLKDNAGSIKHQLGHGQDEKMLRMLRKYQSAMLAVLQGLREMGSNGECASVAVRDIRAVLADLDALAEEHSLT